MENLEKRYTLVMVDKSNNEKNGIPVAIETKPIPPPATKFIWHENATFLVAVIGLIGVLCTVGLGLWRMKKELALALTLAKDARNYSKEQAQEDRNLAMDQANAERKHSADEAHRERIATARRSVYLEAAKEVVKAHAFIGGLPMKNIGENNENEGLNELGAAVSQISILGGMDTVLKSREVLSLINLLYFKALAMTVPMSIKRASISTLSSKRDVTDKKASDMRQQFLDRSRDGVYIKEVADLAENSRILYDQTIEYANNIVSEQNDFTKLQYEYIEFVIKELGEIQKGTDELIIMIRRELELDVDSEALFKSTLDTQALVQKAADELRTNMENY